MMRWLACSHGLRSSKEHLQPFNHVINQVCLFVHLPEMFSIDDAHLFHPQGKKGLIMNFVFVTFCFGVRVHVGIKMVTELLLRDVGGGSEK